MDPNETLREIRKLTTKHNNDSAGFDVIDTAMLVELVFALDMWLVSGGFLPDEWSR